MVPSSKDNRTTKTKHLLSSTIQGQQNSSLHLPQEIAAFKRKTKRPPYHSGIAHRNAEYQSEYKHPQHQQTQLPRTIQPE